MDEPQQEHDQELTPEQQQELRKAYEAQMQIFGTTGWREFFGWVANMAKQHNTLLGLDTVEQLHFRKGQLDILSLIVAYPDMIDQAYQALAEQTGEEAPTTGGKATAVGSAEDDE